MNYTQPVLSSSCLLTIDVQNDFSLAGAKAEIKGTMAIIPKVAKLLKLYRKKHLPIIHIVRLYKQNGSNVDIARREKIQNGWNIVTPGSHGAELVSDLKPSLEIKLNPDLLLAGKAQQIGENEFIIYKPRWGAFYQTPLEKLLNKIDSTTLVFTGCNFPNCPRTSIYEASERDFKLIAVADALSGIYEKGVTELHAIGVHILSTQQLVTQLNSLQ